MTAMESNREAHVYNENHDLEGENNQKIDYRK